MRGRRSRGRKSGPSTVTIPVQATSVGAVSANQFTGWTHSAGTITNRTAYGVTANYFNLGTSATVDLQSKAVSRDHEVEFWAYSYRAYIRIADGKAFRAQVGGGSWVIEFVSIGSSGYESDTVIASLGSGTISGFNGSDTDGDTYVFGAEGFEVYLKWNGTDQFREKQIFHHKPGRVGFRHEIDTPFSGLRSCTATFKASVPLYSTPEFSILDVRDFGVLPISTTGSMTGGSTTLTVASNPGFTIGDPVIVEIGGESGAGARGTRGVGGQWPTLTYANATAMNADTSQVTNKMCALIDTGAVYQWDGSSWDAVASTGFFDLMLPKALLATITNISGTTITLDTAATVSTTNANVYLNCAEKFEEVLGGVYFTLDDYITDKTIEFPAGDFAWGTYNERIGFGNNRIRWNVRGKGEENTSIFSPNGTTSLDIQMASWTGPGEFRDVSLDSNCRATGGYQFYYNATTDVPEQGASSNLRFQTSTDLEIYNVTTSDHAQAGITISYCNDVNVNDCTINHATGHRAYTAWSLSFANSENCVADNITIDSDYYTTGFEQFQCTGCTFSNITGRNTFCSVNSSDNWTYSGINITLETGACDATWFDWHSNFSPVVNINSNIDNQQGNGDGAANGVFEDFHIVQETDFRSGHVFAMINISGTVDYITIRGHFPDKPNTLGLIEMPNYSSIEPGAIRDDSASKYITVDGVRAIGVNSGGPDIGIDSANGIVQNCVADTIYCGGTQTDNITNAEYEALP